MTLPFPFQANTGKKKAMRENEQRKHVFQQLLQNAKISSWRKLLKKREEKRNTFKSIASTYTPIRRCTNIWFTMTWFSVSILVMQPVLKRKLSFIKLLMRFPTWLELLPSLLLNIVLLLQGSFLLLSKHVLPTWFNLFSSKLLWQ